MLEPAASAVKPRRFRRWALVVVLGVGIAYLVLTVMVFSFQESIIFPGAATQGQADATLHPGPDQQLITLRGHDGVPIAALFGKALQANGQPLGDASKRPTVIFFYGNGACMAYCTDIFDHLRRIGVNAMIPDFEGYGMSGGKASEAGCYATADAVYDYLLTRQDIDAKQIIPMGWSLGAAAAIDLAARRPVAKVITISAFTNLHAMGRRFYPWLPTSLILKYRFDNLAKISGVSCPMLIAHGTADDLIPPVMSERLIAAATAPVTGLLIDGAGHNDVFDTGGKELWNAVEKFISPTFWGKPVEAGEK
jgi:pimeloyl-ACP methyl ester carboxylesterase